MRLAESLTICGKELRDLVRDRRALFFAFILPLLVYPALFFVMGRIEGMRREAAGSRPSRVAVSGIGADLRKRLACDPDLELIDGSMDWGAVERGEADALLAAPGSAADSPGERLDLAVFFNSSEPASQEARRRLQEVLEEHRLDLLTRRFAGRGSPVDPRQEAAFSARDLASAEERAGAALGRLLPFILIGLLLTGGAFAAIDLVAGEKERGTLETLFTQPVEPGSVVLGKFLAILGTSLAAVFLNLAGMAGALLLGLGPSGSGSGLAAMPNLSAVAVTILLITPLAVLTSAILLALSTLARSFREAQMYLLPVTLVAMLPALISAAPDIHLSLAVAVIPVASAALAIRDALLGEIRPAFLAVALGSTALYAALALRWAAGLLAREDLRLGLEPEPLLTASAGAARARRGLLFGIIMVVFIGMAGSIAQRPDGPLGIWGGLALTLWGIVLVPALLYVKVLHLDFRQSLALRRPRARDLLCAVALVPFSALLITAYMTFQDKVLPFPEGIGKEMEKIFSAGELHPALAALIIAFSPAVCEEILWRGAVQSEIESEGRPWKTVFLVGLLFGLFHLDAYRFVPTALLGALLAFLRLRTGSLFPCMVFHGLYNATMLFGARWAGERLPQWAGRPEVMAVCAAGLLLLLRWGVSRDKIRQSC